MIQTPIKSRWLLIVCGILEAVASALYLSRPEGPLTFHLSRGTVVAWGQLALAAGICAIAAGIWNLRQSKSWLLMLNGVACGALGGILAFWTGPIAFRTLALLIAVMAVSIGIYGLVNTRSLARLRDEWLLGGMAVISFAFAIAFAAFVFRWVNLNPGSPAQSLYWLGSYFGFSAICMIILSLPLHRRIAS